MSKKKILIIMPYSAIYPPKNGGMLRCFNLFLQYSKYYEVTVVLFQDKESFIASARFYPEVKHANVFSTKDAKKKISTFSIFPKKIGEALLYRWIKKSLKVTTDSSFLELYSVTKLLMKKNKYDAIVLENLSLVEHCDFFKKYNQDAAIIYDAHNVDSELARQAFEKGQAPIINYNITYAIESNLYNKVDILLCCSENDKLIFNRLNQFRLKQTVVVPNGVDINKAPYYYQQTEETLKNILFCGSLDYSPNQEGLMWFYEEVWTKISKVKIGLKLNIVGRGDKKLYAKLIEDPTVNFIGEVESLTPYYRSNCISIAPLKSGSGTRLKILEAMSFGTPVVSTTIGAEGILCSSGEEILIADTEEAFANAVITMIDNIELANSISRNARKLVQEVYCWESIGKKISQLI